MVTQENKRRKLSFLMSCYAKDDPIALRDALHSINESGELFEFQVVIVLDGPVGEGLSSVIDRYIDISNNDVCVHPLAKNVGLGLALQSGVMMCSGEFIFRMDSDDISIPSRVPICVDFLDRNPKVDVVGGYIQEFEQVPGDKQQLIQPNF